MTQFTPKLVAKPQQPAGPKLSYAIGEEAWVYAGLTDQHGNPKMSRGKVVFWVDLGDWAQRLYIIRLQDGDFLHHLTREATVMSPDGVTPFPFRQTRHDNTASRPVPYVPTQLHA